MTLAKITTSITDIYNVENATAYGITSLVFYVLFVIALWKMFEKAGIAGWKAIIPVYNVIIELKIAGLSPWLILLFLVPIANIVIQILLCSGLAKAYGKGTGYAVGLIFLYPIFILILGFNSSKYVGTVK